jgi:hypothetical protein
MCASKVGPRRKEPTRPNLGAASLFSFVMVAKISSINAFISLSLETTTETNPPAKNVSRIYAQNAHAFPKHSW